ncbi:MAG: hypothetical protein IT428_01515 [Planctomycetaceae bacterium]|nr:hypothetical protein [Planctomycetaceae bacterium]
MSELAASKSASAGAPPLRLWAGRLMSDPVRPAELFAVANLAFLAVDIYVAHSVNGFAHWAEWIPFGFSLIAPFLLLAAMAIEGRIVPARPLPGGRMRGRAWIARAVGLFVGAGSVLVGVAGLLWHLESQFFQDQTLRSLVYTAPFAAPLSYTGIGLLLLLDRLRPDEETDWTRWVLVLAMGGFVGNFLLALADHAQGGLLDWNEWIPVVAAALAVGALAVAVGYFRDRAFLTVCLWLMVAQIGVALAGWGFHLATIPESPMGSLWSRILYSAPVFAPLLFADMAILAALPLWTLRAASAANGSPGQARLE